MDLQKISYAALRGFYDSIRGMLAIFSLDKEIKEKALNRQSPTRASNLRQKTSDTTESTLKKLSKKGEESQVMTRIIQCGILNGGIFLVSILLFEYGLLPTINKIFELIFGKESFMGKLVWSWIEPILSFIFKTVWVIPLFLMSKVVNALWFQDIADSAYRHSRGRPIYSQRLSVLLADSIFSTVIQLLFLVQATIISYIPIYVIAQTLSFIQMCMLYSLYAFEYKWFNMGWEIHRRLAFIEMNWPYFIGFGFPMAFFTQLSQSWIISGCVFSILFPFFIISGNEASPVTGASDCPLHFFSPVISISNALFSRTVGNPPRSTTTEKTAQYDR